MITNHLTDENLQAFLLKEIQDHTIEFHLRECPICREKLKNYEHLLVDISKMAPETFSFDVTTVVMEIIKEVETKKEKNINILIYMSLCVFSIIALILLYPYFKIVITQFKSFSIMANVFMLVSVLGVVVFLMIDLFRQYKQKEMLLS